MPTSALAQTSGEQIDTQTVSHTSIDEDREIEVFVTNFNRNYTGVSATANGVLSQQQKHQSVKLVGRPLPVDPKPLTLRQAITKCWQPPRHRPFAIWHVRRNSEMFAGLFARDVLRLPIRLLFTSAAKRRHSPIPRALISRMDAVVATTPEAADYVPHVAAVVPHGVDTDLFVPPEDRAKAWASTGMPGQFGIGIVGRVRPEKGTDLFVESMLQVLPQRPDFSAIIIGRALAQHAAFEQSLKDQIRQAGLESRCRFVGEVPPQKMPQLIQGLSLLVAPPRYEGYGVTPLEGMACGAPVVASDTGAFAEMIVQGQTGYVVPVGDVRVLTDAILNITADRHRLVQMGLDARERVVQHFALAQEAQQINNIYQQLWNGDRF